jgi:hypothetical protein
VQRYTDEDWQSSYDNLGQEAKDKAYSLPMKNLFD